MNGIVGPLAFKYEPRKHVLHILRNPGHASVHPKLISLNLYIVHFFFLIFGHMHSMWDAIPQPRMEPAAPALEGRVLTTGPRGNPYVAHSYLRLSYHLK